MAWRALLTGFRRPAIADTPAVVRTITSWDGLLADCQDGARLRGSPIHGEEHWRAVAATGMGLTAFGADPEMCLAFGMLHDCRRADEFGDPWHGEEAAEYARNNRHLHGLLGQERAAAVLRACEVHSLPAPYGDDMRIGACLDADRLNLVRLGIRPRADLMSAIPAGPALEEAIASAEKIWRSPPPWGSLMASLRR